MQLTVNGETRDMDVGELAELCDAVLSEREENSPKGVAIALNGSVIRRNLWSQTPVKDGDRIEIVRVLSGG